jgi:hypothetical protein
MIYALLTKYYLGDRIIKKYEMGGARDTLRGEERSILAFGVENWRKENIWKT